MSVKPSGSERSLGTAAPEALSLWADEPLLMRRKNGYRGRVVAEVWRDGSVRVITSNGALIRQALTVLSDERVATDSVSDPKAPITGPNGEAEFLGRVIVELWHDKFQIGVTGSQVTLLRRKALEGLQQLARST
jgi:hypothetical protein